MSKVEVSGYYCTYCGMGAQDLDHVIPWSQNHLSCENKTVNKKDCVPACKECNGLLGHSLIVTIAERAALVAVKLERKYRDLLKSPDWSDTEYEELTGRLKRQIRSMQRKKKLVRSRVSYAESVGRMSDLDIPAVWEQIQI